MSLSKHVSLQEAIRAFSSKDMIAFTTSPYKVVNDVLLCFITPFVQQYFMFENICSPDNSVIKYDAGFKPRLARSSCIKQAIDACGFDQTLNRNSQN